MTIGLALVFGLDSLMEMGNHLFSGVVLHKA
jgi:hypothetical protein